MSDAKRCDRCYNFYEKNETASLGVFSNDGGEAWDPKDLCSKCVRALNEFMILKLKKVEPKPSSVDSEVITYKRNIQTFSDDRREKASKSRKKICELAKEIRMEGEVWTAAMARAAKQLKEPIQFESKIKINKEGEDLAKKNLDEHFKQGSSLLIAETLGPDISQIIKNAPSDKTEETNETTITPGKCVYCQVQVPEGKDLCQNCSDGMEQFNKIQT